MKSPKELNFAQNLMTILKGAEQQGVDIKNVISSLNTRFEKDDKDPKAREPINVRTLVGKKVLYTSAQDYGIRLGVVISVSPKGFVEMESHYKVNDTETKQISWIDPANLYIQEIFENDNSVPKK